jgi:hypothetical protein
LDKILAQIAILFVFALYGVAAVSHRQIYPFLYHNMYAWTIDGSASWELHYKVRLKGADHLTEINEDNHFFTPFFNRRFFNTVGIEDNIAKKYGILLDVEKHNKAIFEIIEQHFNWYNNFFAKSPKYEGPSDEISELQVYWKQVLLKPDFTTKTLDQTDSIINCYSTKGKCDFYP